jgi:hypothetical protein
MVNQKLFVTPDMLSAERNKTPNIAAKQATPTSPVSEIIVVAVMRFWEA